MLAGGVMSTNLDRYRSDLDALIELGDNMYADLQARYLEKEGKLSKEQKESAKKIRGTFEVEYQKWYTEASAVIHQLVPDRLAEFEDLYKGDGKRKAVNAINYTVQDWLNGMRAGNKNYSKEKHFDDFATVTMRFATQLQILKTASRRFESSLLDIRQLVQADLLDSEIDSARELVKQRFLRAAGAVAGVVLEKHLGRVAANHSIPVRKKHPTISDLNDLLKSSTVIDIPVWRQIQRLGDIRNLCDHSREREPTSDEVEELISGVAKITKTIF
jgi:hypothetical protein